jgi:hypothetical protein
VHRSVVAAGRFLDALHQQGRPLAQRRRGQRLHDVQADIHSRGAEEPRQRLGHVREVRQIPEAVEAEEPGDEEQVMGRAHRARLYAAQRSMSQAIEALRSLRPSALR